ncbi:squalene--hopene cyclase [Microvirga puerhi]|uniref:Squalene--hopene cyclase n=1 Tax=Microvirga puerhi TaxID=2876078 RepID=A0ABS7VS50_9HYPH|nr:squalene--hopene cyclase [Microvirga puerhi]MBZ6077986.1 squalene--hopene cyclase [Microvirga puerhi]
MRRLSLDRIEASPELIDAKIDTTSRALIAQAQADGHWRFELEADATISAEYVLLKHYLGEPAKSDLEDKIAAYLRRIQAGDGGWPLFHGGSSDLSASVKAYFALKMIGDAPDALHMRRARDLILVHGGAAQSNVFTRTLLALYGDIPWRAVPVMPVEMMLLPRWFPFHLSKISYWARTVLVPLMVLQVLKPKARSRNGIDVQELFVTAPSSERKWPRGAHQTSTWAHLFRMIDAVLHKTERFFPKGSRERAIQAAIAFVEERLNGQDGLGAIFPAMANAMMMYNALGYPGDHPRMVSAREAIERLLVVKSNEAYCQPCLSPVWDTVLACQALFEAESDDARRYGLGGIAWLKRRQVLDVAGDWAATCPHVRPGGWAFQYGNPYYPDVDDTAVVVMTMHRAQALLPPMASLALEEPIARGREWVIGLQSRNGGWGAFDTDNSYAYLNHIPFADHGALLDPPTVDVTARCVSMLAQLGDKPEPGSPLARGIEYLLAEQKDDGSWFGRWGINYIYGTWSALCALHAARVDPHSDAMRQAVDWLIRIQNPDGGWGEGGDSYRLDYRSYQPVQSTASQSAWALLGLMAAGEAEHPAVSRGIEYLCNTQGQDGFWPEEHFTATGFPRVFYLRYHGYPKFFPLWALARYRSLKAGTVGARDWVGM